MAGLRAPPVERGHVEPLDRGGLGPDGGQRLARRRALHRDHGPGGRGVDRITVARRAQRSHHPIGVRRVGHDVERRVVDPPDDDVVEHGRIVGVEQVGVLRPPRLDLGEVVGEGALQPFEGARPGHPHGARIGDEEPGHDLQQRRLARPVRPNHPDEASLRDMQRQIGQRRQKIHRNGAQEGGQPLGQPGVPLAGDAVGLGDVVDLDGVHPRNARAVAAAAGGRRAARPA